LRLSEHLIRLRKAKGWTQMEAAQHIQIQQSYLSKLENGHYVPSDEVITKLSAAYGVAPKELRPQELGAEQELGQTDKGKQKRKWQALLILCPFLGLFLIISGTNSLIFSTTYYTYKTEPISEVNQTELHFNYHLSDMYLGEKFISESSGVRYHFTLIATRDVDRQENKIQLIAGMLILFLSVAVYLRKLVDRF